MYLNQEIIHANKKSKFKQSEYSFTATQRDLFDPESVFPAKKIKSMMKGKDKKRKLAKRDMQLGVEKYLGGKIDYRGKQMWASIPLGPPVDDAEIGYDKIGPRAIRHTFYNQAVLFIYRVVLDRQPMWILAEVGGPHVAKKGRPTASGSSHMTSETEALMVVLRDLKKKAAKINDPKKLLRMAEHAFVASEKMNEKA